MQRHQQRRRGYQPRRRPIDLNPPGAAIRLDAASKQFAADFDQRMMNAMFAQRCHQQINSEAFGDAAEIQLRGCVAAAIGAV